MPDLRQSAADRKPLCRLPGPPGLGVAPLLLGLRERGGHPKRRPRCQHRPDQTEWIGLIESLVAARFRIERSFEKTLRLKDNAIQRDAYLTEWCEIIAANRQLLDRALTRIAASGPVARAALARALGLDRLNPAHVREQQAERRKLKLLHKEIRSSSRTSSTVRRHFLLQVKFHLALHNWHQDLTETGQPSIRCRENADHRTLQVEGADAQRDWRIAAGLASGPPPPADLTTEEPQSTTASRAVVLFLFSRESRA